ncbi:Ca2+-binding RTX toxin-like protein [Rhodovulum iodosum]|uniref:Ca2+-binding RTX toxin-like protein n=1 Tax=Rhodovulum iodosum TaxID=68291 RepID=A0ABV3XQH8_9RHOB|nr:FG-GAP repeat protein [Rhodovulum robiginosum]RSK31365.1 hypothetical protein EJA01_14540 [Rhodovulum robiginosum]
MAIQIPEAIDDAAFGFSVEGNLNISGYPSGVGSAVSVLGDFNGDGIDDFIVGAPGLDKSEIGSTREDAGGAFIIYGGSALASDVTDGVFDLTLSSSDLAGNGLYVQGALEFDDLTGTAAGDVNNDGYADALLAAPSFVEVDGGPFGTTYDHRPGTAYILYGGPSAEALAEAGTGLIDLADMPAMSDGSPAITIIEGEAEGLRLGLSMTGGGDLNGDGFADLALGTFQADGIFYEPDGSPLEIPSFPGIPSPSSALGRVYGIFGDEEMPAVISLGADIVEGDGSQGFYTAGYVESEDDGDGGSRPVFSGLIGMFDTLGMADLDGDGLSELMVGAPFGGALQDGPEDSQYTSGGLFLLHFEDGVSPGAEVTLRDQYFLQGEVTGEITAAGFSPSDLGDIDGDGVSDIGVLAPLLDRTGVSPATNVGAVYAILGDEGLFDGGLPRRGTLAGDGDVRLLGNAEGDAADPAFDLLSEDGEVDEDTGGLTSGLSALGDVNGDGIGDFGIGFLNAGDGKGAVYVVLGRDGEGSLTPFASLGMVSDDPDTAGMLRLDGATADSAGYALASGDLDGDGTPELLIGAPGDLVALDDDGKVYVLSGGELFEGAGGSTIFGTPGADSLTGTAGDDRIEAGDGPDTVNAEAGDDVVLGGATSADRRDEIYGGDGNDDIDAGYGNDLVFGMNGDDRISGGFGADDLRGQAGNDVITGGALSDLVFGGDGNDFVNGGFGFDRINGGAGADDFYHLGIANHGSDWVQDYDAAEGDVLLFSDATASVDDFNVRFTHTSSPATGRSGDDDVQEAFVVYRPEGLIVWALVDGAGQDSLNIEIGGEVFDLLA